MANEYNCVYKLDCSLFLIWNLTPKVPGQLLYIIDTLCP